MAGALWPLDSSNVQANAWRPDSNCAARWRCFEEDRAAFSNHYTATCVTASMALLAWYLSTLTPLDMLSQGLSTRGQGRLEQDLFRLSCSGSLLLLWGVVPTSSAHYGIQEQRWIIIYTTSSFQVVAFRTRDCESYDSCSLIITKKEQQNNQ